MTRDVRLRQLSAVAALELRRLARSREGRAALFFAAVPLLLALVVRTLAGSAPNAGRVERDFAFVFQNLVLQGTLFFGTLFVFGGLVRGEQLAKTLHHLFLAPVRRELVVLGKYFAAFAATSVAFGGFSALAYLALLSGASRGGALGPLAEGGAGRALAYAGVAVLACAAYGAVFLAFGQAARNPAFPALVFWGWEHLNFLLPEVLKRLGLVHYLLSLTPVKPPHGFLAILGDPLPAWVAIPVPLLFAAALLAFSAWKARRTEVDYGTE
jgi:hypothetical protein